MHFEVCFFFFFFFFFFCFFFFFFFFVFCFLFFFFEWHVTWMGLEVVIITHCTPFFSSPEPKGNWAGILLIVIQFEVWSNTGSGCMMINVETNCCRRH